MKKLCDEAAFIALKRYNEGSSKEMTICFSDLEQVNHFFFFWL